MGGLVEQAFTVEKLRQAWDDVLENDGEDGTLSSGTVLFLEDVDDNLAQLAAVLADGSYVPGELTPVTIVTGQKSRELHIPRVRDRIVARALMTAVTPLVDPHLGSNKTLSLIQRPYVPLARKPRGFWAFLRFGACKGVRRAAR